MESDSNYYAACTIDRQSRVRDSPNFETDPRSEKRVNISNTDAHCGKFNMDVRVNSCGIRSI